MGEGTRVGGQGVCVRRLVSSEDGYLDIERHKSARFRRDFDAISTRFRRDFDAKVALALRLICVCKMSREPLGFLTPA